MSATTPSEAQPTPPMNNGHDIATASDRGLTVTFQDVAVEVHGLGEDYGSTCLSVVKDLIPSLRSSAKSTRRILQGVTGQVRPGETLLVLGRPGSGCTTLLKIIANMRGEYHRVTGQVTYGNLSSKQAEQFRHQITMNTEDDLHYPTLKVSETINFAASTKLSRSRASGSTSDLSYTDEQTEKVLSSLGIAHTADTMVGDEFIRGVSGGERKRVSLAEVIATGALIQCWDNSTRGLDASNALDFARVLRRAADEERKSVIATLYQAGNGIYSQFDKVLVLAEGRELFYGPAQTAKRYFEEMGFECAPGANIADFLTSVAVHTEREILPGYENRVPNTVEEFETAYKASDIYAEMARQINSQSRESLSAEVEDLKEMWQSEKNRTVGLLSRQKSPYHVSFGQQVVACTRRQFQVLWGDRWSNCLKVGSALVIAIVTGSLFYNLPHTTASIFSRAGALFWPILHFGLLAMSETTAAFMGRPITSRHKRLAFSRPAAQALACTIADVPFVVAMFSIYEIVYYFMVQFEQDAGKFFTQWFIFIVCTLCLTSFYRMVGAWCKHFGFASQIAGWCTMVMMVYAGYLIPVPAMHVWFRWISYINPVNYAFSAVMGSEISGLVMECVEPQYVPYGASYDNSTYRSCTLAGSTTGSSTVYGESYLQSQYGDPTQHVWRNAGIVIAFWVFFATMSAIGFELNLHADAGSQVLFDKRNKERETMLGGDTEKGMISDSSSANSGNASNGIMSSASTVFTFRDINYYVHVAGKEKQLLQNVSGFVTPGKLVALMGSSGAGKTTLMDALAQRKDYGRLTGSILVNGKPQGISFQRTTGYCEQNDVHEPTSTVREALLFSARLRQKHNIPDDEKVAYVEKVMDLLELRPLQHAIIGTPGSGLSIEQRKRLTIATELVAKPSLLFLDEPTSGLDGQSAYEICRYMRKLAATGQTIIATIHQPSAALFEAFDDLLLLTRGGKTTYFGPTGKGSSVVLDYFNQRNAPCPEGANPAEHIVDVVQGRLDPNVDWAQQWTESAERQQRMAELERLQVVQDQHEETDDDMMSFAAPLPYQLALVTQRQLVSLWRNPDYVWNKIGLHVTNALFGGFTFWMIGDGTFDLQLRLMSVFNFVFVAPGCINQLQPLFLQNRDIFDTREKKSKTYSWLAFIAGQLISEIPVLILCGTIYFVCWYFTCGFPVTASKSGQVYLEMLFYEFLYTSIGQAIAAYSPNAYFAALLNPLLIGAGLIMFCGVIVPYGEIQAFWRYWLYYIDPFTYLIGALLTPVAWDAKVVCESGELTHIPLPSNTTCGDYMSEFLSQAAGYVADSTSTTSCDYCPYTTGADYLKTMNINAKYYGWRDVGITALFCISSYAFVFLMMKLRAKATKTAS
ncbi:putative ABC multidrug transporter [Truncatella angustata]|uniref:ABC multidrug transporter n=1 Tax=Truncatella angustata TaxID=152316 RepID=A0A9P9A0I8_9PEZI|nr:putative ABC multidrug transporter [Truncatella angustata]KAH6658427.1 putative ABC multidrug transporter [Truncatella angustata]